jgi:4Fe-4S ferredoxin
MESMPIKNNKIEDAQQLSVERVLYAKRFNLTVDRNLCKGCDVCKVVCPREAIALRSIPKEEDTAQAPLVDVDEQICDYHGICSAMCPFNAITITINEETGNPVVVKDCFPELLRDIRVDDAHCEPNCKICEEECPLQIIDVTFGPLTIEEAEAKNIDPQRAGQKTIVEVKRELCPTCRVCEAVCPVGVIQVTKFFNGTITIEQEKCPEGCQDCLDVCPVSALYLGDDGKVYVNDMFCMYCRACVNVCPQPEALDVQRISVNHSPVKSGAWYKALEKLTSTSGVKRELRAKSSSKAVEAVRNLQ